MEKGRTKQQSTTDHENADASSVVPLLLATVILLMYAMSVRARRCYIQRAQPGTGKRARSEESGDGAKEVGDDVLALCRASLRSSYSLHLGSTLLSSLSST